MHPRRFRLFLRLRSEKRQPSLQRFAQIPPLSLWKRQLVAALSFRCIFYSPSLIKGRLCGIICVVNLDDQTKWAIERLDAKIEPVEPKPKPEQSFGESGVVLWLSNAVFFLVKWAVYLFLASMFISFLWAPILIALVLSFALSGSGGIEQFSGKQYPIMKGRAGRDYG